MSSMLISSTEALTNFNCTPLDVYINLYVYNHLSPINFIMIVRISYRKYVLTFSHTYFAIVHSCKKFLTHILSIFLSFSPSLSFVWSPDVKNVKFTKYSVTERRFPITQERTLGELENVVRTCHVYSPSKLVPLSLVVYLLDRYVVLLTPEETWKFVELQKTSARMSRKKSVPLSTNRNMKNVNKIK